MSNMNVGLLRGEFCFGGTDHFWGTLISRQSHVFSQQDRFSRYEKAWIWARLIWYLPDDLELLVMHHSSNQGRVSFHVVLTLNLLLCSMTIVLSKKTTYLASKTLLDLSPTPARRLCRFCHLAGNSISQCRSNWAVLRNNFHVLVVLLWELLVFFCYFG